MATQNYDINLNVKANGAEDATKKIADLNKEAEKAASSNGGLGKFADTVSETGANLKDLASGNLASATSAIRTFAGAFSGAAGVMTGFAATGVAVAAAVEGIGMQMSAAADDAVEFADKLGVTTLKLEALKLIADENSGSVEGLQRVYDKLSKSMTKLDEDNEKTAYAFKVLGISADEAGQMTEAALAGRIIGAYEDLDRSAKATAAVQQLLGGAFRDQIPAIKAAEEGMGDYLKRVRDFGAEASPMLVQKGAEQETALSNLGLAWKGLKNQIAEFSTGIATDVAAWAASVIKSISDVLRAWREGQAQTQARNDSISPQRRAALRKQAMDEVYRPGNQNATLADVERRLSELISAEQNSNFRRMEAGQVGSANAAAAENARVEKLRRESAAVKPPTPGGGAGSSARPKEVRDVLGDALPRLLEAQNERDYRAEQARLAVIARQNELAQRGAGGIAGIGAGAVSSVGFSNRTAGMGSVDRETLAGLDQVAARTTEAIAGLDSATEGYTDRVKQLQQAENEATAAIILAGEERKKANMDWTMGAKNAFASYLDDVTNVANKTQELFSSAFKKAEDTLVDFVMTGKLEVKGLISSILADLARYLIQTQVMAPIIAGLKALMGFANGGVFSGGAVQAFADGGVVNRPMLFPMAGGKTGLMGEAGPEAIMPLKRGPDGKLGVTVNGGSAGGVQIGSISIVVQGGNTNEETADALRRELTSTMQKIADGRIANARRQGGLLNPI